MDGFRVMAARCDQCLYSRDKIVSDARRKDVLATCREQESYFVCHKASIAGVAPICCRGFYDAVGEDGPAAMQLAIRFERMGLRVVTWIDPATLDEQTEGGHGRRREAGGQGAG